MEPSWKRLLDAARARVVADGRELLALLTSRSTTVRSAALDVLVSVCWREEDFLIAYLQVLMRERNYG